MEWLVIWGVAQTAGFDFSFKYGATDPSYS